MSLLAVQSAVLDAMEAWERTHPTSSAWPTFKRAWAQACRMERYLPSLRDRQITWQLWLEGGAPLTRQREGELLEAAGPGAAHILRALKITPRDPGEEG